MCLILLPSDSPLHRLNINKSRADERMAKEATVPNPTAGESTVQSTPIMVLETKSPTPSTV